MDFFFEDFLQRWKAAAVNLVPLRGYTFFFILLVFVFSTKNKEMPQNFSGSVECLTQSQGLLVPASQEALHCVLEQDTLSSAKYAWFNP